MKRLNTSWILVGIIVLLSAALIGVIVFVGNTATPTRGVAPLKVIAAHRATNRMKKLTPSTTRVPGATGCSGFTI